MTPTPTGTEARVCQDIAERQAHGLAKYGVSVESNPLTLRQWLQHAYEETLDKAIYLRRAIEEIDKACSNPEAVKAALLAEGLPFDEWETGESTLFMIIDPKLSLEVYPNGCFVVAHRLPERRSYLEFNDLAEAVKRARRIFDDTER